MAAVVAAVGVIVVVAVFTTVEFVRDDISGDGTADTAQNRAQLSLAQLMAHEGARASADQCGAEALLPVLRGGVIRVPVRLLLPVLLLLGILSVRGRVGRVRARREVGRGRLCAGRPGAVVIRWWVIGVGGAWTRVLRLRWVGRQVLRRLRRWRCVAWL